LNSTYTYSWNNGATAITGASNNTYVANASGSYTLTITDANGCTATSAAIPVTVNVLPVVTAAANGPTTFCTGGSVTLTATGAATYVWSNGATTPSITVNASDVITVVGTTDVGCSATSHAITVTVNALTVGATYGGGKIGYILQVGDPGYIAGEMHGLIAAPSDQSTGIQWGCISTTVGGTSNSLGTGAANTVIVSSACGAGTAARLCADLILNGYSDWYLPSKDELQKIRINRIAIGGFSITGTYWSSSEYDYIYVWVTFFSIGGSDGYAKRAPANVRAVRSF
jgi:hypothetical protein